MKPPWQDESIAPNGCRVKENFQLWFGDSVVRINGDPLVVYHGTDAEFDVFELTEDIGYHFGSLECAKRRLEQIEATDGRVLAVHLSISKPLRLRDLHTWTSGSVADALQDAGLLDDDEAFEFASYNDLDMIRDLLSKHGYDGIVYENETEGGGDSYIVFDPRKIKLADANSGLFDPDSPSMSDKNAALLLLAEQALKETKPVDRRQPNPSR